MSRIVRFPVGEAEISKREISRILSSLALQRISYINPLIVRAKLAQAVSQRLKEIMESFKINQKYSRITSTSWGKAYLNSIVIDQVRRYVKDTATISMIRRDLKKLYRDPSITGEKLLKEIEKTLAKYIDDRHVLKKVVRAFESRIIFSETSKRGVIDPVEKKAAYVSKDGRFVFKKNVKDMDSVAKEAGIRFRLDDIVEEKLTKITIESIENSETVDEATAIFTKRYNELLQSDPKFRMAMEKKMMDDIMKYYNIALLMKAGEELMTYIPSMVITTVSKLLARAAAVLPFVGNVASIQYEAAAAVSEIGRNLKDRVESSSHMWFNLDPSIAPIVKESIEKQLQQKATA